MTKTILISAILFVLGTVACAPVSSPSPAPSPSAPVAIEPVELRLMTHDSFAASEDVIRAFEQSQNAKVVILQSGDAGTALNKAILARENPLADVFYGVDNTFLGRALQEGIFLPYDSPLLKNIPAEFQLDPQRSALPVDYGDVCLNYDKAYFQEKNLVPPGNLEDLLKPEYKSLLVVQNPATSSPGLAFMFATIGHFGEAGYLDYWQGLVENDVLVVNDWEQAYYAEFTRAGGNRPIVVSYGSSPAFEVIYAETPVDQPPTGVVVGDGACFRQVEFVGILKGAKNMELAEKWVDFMLSPMFQEDIPLQMFVFPVNRDAKLDETFIKYLAVPQNLAVVPPEEIAAKRETWIKAWTEKVLR